MFEINWACNMIPDFMVWMSYILHISINSHFRWLISGRKYTSQNSSKTSHLSTARADIIAHLHVQIYQNKWDGYARPGSGFENSSVVLSPIENWISMIFLLYENVEKM